MEQGQEREQRIYGSANFVQNSMGQWVVSEAPSRNDQGGDGQPALHGIDTEQVSSVDGTAHLYSTSVQPTAPSSAEKPTVEAKTPLFSTAQENSERGHQIDQAEVRRGERLRRRFGFKRRMRAIGATMLLAVSSVFPGATPSHVGEMTTPDPIESDFVSDKGPEEGDGVDRLGALASLSMAPINRVGDNTPDSEVDLLQEGLISSQGAIVASEGDTVSKVVLEDVFGAQSVESGTMDTVIQNNKILYQIFLEAMVEFQHNNPAITNIDQISIGQALNIGGYSDEFLQKAEKGKKAYESLKAQA